MARTPSAMDVPFHTDIGFLAQTGRGLLRDPHKAQAQARRLSVCRRPASRNQPLPRRAQPPLKALHLDRRSRQNHRRRQARAPSVRFDPLALYESIADVEALERADQEEYWYENRFSFQWKDFCSTVQYGRRFFKIKELLDNLF